MDSEARLAVYEAAEQIQRLKYDYGAACDDNYNPSAIGRLFTEDAVGDWRPRGALCEGRESIEAMFEEIGKSISWATHVLTNPRIEVAPNLQEARGVWTIMTLASQRGRPLLIVGRYDDQYVKVGTQWLHSQLTIKYGVAAPWTEGW